MKSWIDENAMVWMSNFIQMEKQRDCLTVKLWEREQTSSNIDLLDINSSYFAELQVSYSV